MLITVSGLGFAASHFLAGHPTCGRLHGHNYRVEIVCEGEPDDRGMVADFHDIRAAAAAVLDEVDHLTLLPGKSSEVSVAVEGDEVHVTGCKSLVLPREDVVVLPVRNTTCEELAVWLHDRLVEDVPSLVNVRLWENERSSAAYP